MKNFLKIFTRERVVFGIIISLIGLAGTIYTARSTSAEQTRQELNAFKETTIEDIGEINGKIDVLKATIDASDYQMDKRIEAIQGSLNTITSKLLDK